MNDTGNFVIFGPKANCTLELCPIEMSVYGYRPSLPANIAFTALFTLATFAHAYLGFKWKTPCRGQSRASSSGASQVGVDVAMAGLILQVIMLVTFSLLFGDYMFRYLRSKKSRNLGSRDKLFFAFLAIAVLATLARCVFRADELKEGYQGELIKHEDLFVTLEGVLIVVAVFCLFVAHPGFVFNRPAKVYYSVATGTEATEEMAYRSKLADPVSESEH
ncbi:parasitic phase-specific PSP-1 [Fusarium subglutinans]|uniref:Parasitic phase-specific PSP-1 n=1 Tax=Gibberella subglutinans TaxID=42677 RepID=A0A8H5PVA3_GIBSU|nr:parasitic phase-specific PSP-1 [Fusarium subglutinans]KAF5602888.1 parasitic phase-specific PSP-1 [Fusarium subglutinans]